MAHQSEPGLWVPDIGAGRQVRQVPGFELDRKDLHTAESDEEDRHRISDKGEGCDQIVKKRVLCDRRYQAQDQGKNENENLGSAHKDKGQSAGAG